MKHQKPALAIGLVSACLAAALWTLCAQERPAWGPPPVLPPVKSEKSAGKSTSKPKKKNEPDPTMIIPPEVFEAPKRVSPPMELNGNIVQTAGQDPLPAFPPLAAPMKEDTPPALPTLEKGPVAPPDPLPPPEPTKVLIVDRPETDALKKTSGTGDTPKILDLPPPNAKPEVAPAPLPELMKEPVAPKTKELVPLPQKMNEPATPLPATPTPSPPMPAPPVLPTDAKVAPPAPTLETKRAPGAPPIVSMVADDPPALPKPKSFVRIRSQQMETPAPVLPPRKTVVEPLPVGPAPLPPSHAAASGALLNLQAPTVLVDKRGPASLHAGETQLYQVVVRNAGAVVAQQVRVEEEIPADVRLLNADPAPQVHGGRAVWLLSSLAPGAEHALRLTLKADAPVQLTPNISVHVSAGSTTTRAANAPTNLSMRVTGPERVGVGKAAVFEIHLTNTLRQPLTGIVLYGDLPEGLTTPAGNKIEGDVSGIIAPGEFKVLKMPATAVKPGRHTVHARVFTQQGEAFATTTIDVHAEAFTMQTSAVTRLAPGRDGDLRIELANHTGRPLRNVQVATLLPEGMVFIGASDRGLFQSNTRTVHWLIDHFPADCSKTLILRLNSAKVGHQQCVLMARADGIAEIRATGAVAVEGSANLALRVNNRDAQLEVGRETIYEIIVQNHGTADAHNVQVLAQFPPNLVARTAQGSTRFSLERQRVAFEPIAVIPAQGQAILRVMAVAQNAGTDQRASFSVSSDEQRTPTVREHSLLLYNGN